MDTLIHPKRHINKVLRARGKLFTTGKKPGFRNSNHFRECIFGIEMTLFSIGMPVSPPYHIYLFCALICLSLIGTIGCNQQTSIDQQEKSPQTSAVKFTLLSPDKTGVDFTNQLKEDYLYNIFTYEYLYNGGGVAAGDVNGDGLPDLYFSSTFGSNKLYLNTGSMTFRDVTEKAGVAALDGFKTGVLMADINGDGLLDIHSCRTSKTNDGKKTDFIFINTGNQEHDGLQIPIFREQAKSLGLEDNSNTNHVCYFDMDNDGDLDVFYLNHRVDFTDATKLRVQQNTDGSLSRIISPLTPFESNRLYRNDQGHFIDITIQAGVVNAAFGLSVTPVDINRDGWMDLYVANDYIEPDHIYINNGNGTFTDKYSEYLKHSSQNSMGCDIADINNDGLEDIIVLDMKAGDHIRYKQLANVMQQDRYQLLVQYGYGRQTGRNMLQLNMGNNQFAEIGQYAGVSSTDWSWAPLLADFNNDGWRDLYITNGYRKDVTNLDYLNFFRDSVQRAGGLSSSRFPDIEEFLKYIPQQKVSNYLFVNTTQLSFNNASEDAGMDQLSFSNGSAYADLDLDGDLDLIVNNINDPAFIYENHSEAQNWIQIKVELEKGNTAGLGVQADVYSGTLHQHAVVGVNRGFLSSSEPILHFGLGEYQQIDSIIVRWPDGSLEKSIGVATNQRLN